MQSQARRLLGVAGAGGREEFVAEHGYDTKYAMHCARLGFQCIELLLTRQLELPIRGEPADWLRAVRRGDVVFADWWDRVLDLDAQLAGLADDGSIPVGPDRDRVEAWSVETHLRLWNAGT